MSSYRYEAVDPGGASMRGTLNVVDQGEAFRRIKEMGLFPTRIARADQNRTRRESTRPRAAVSKRGFGRSIPLPGSRVRARTLAVFTRQLATLVEAGMPLLRGLRILQEQADSPPLKRILDDVALSIEGGGALSEALSAHPKVFNRLYINMVKAGELGGALEVTLRRLADFMEKGQRIKGKIKAAMFYPIAVLIVAATILALMLVYVVPKFQQVFEGLLNGAAMPGFTLFVLGISEVFRSHFLSVAAGAAILAVVFLLGIRTGWGRRKYDRGKLIVPLLGPVFRKVAISRFTRTLGTLLNSGVPVLQALTIVKETTGNVIVGSAISAVHDSVKEGGTIAEPLRASRVFPAMVAGMVDVGEQTGALPDLLMKIADAYDDEVDDAVCAMTSLLEPIMIVFLAVVVGSIVIALFLPIITVINGGGGEGHEF